MAFTVKTGVHEMGAIGALTFVAYSDAQEDLTNRIVLSISTLKNNPLAVEIVAVKLLASNCVAWLEWSHTTNEFIAGATVGVSTEIDFVKDIGVPLRSTNTGGTGDILLSTALANASAIVGTVVYKKLRP